MSSNRGGLDTVGITRLLALIILIIILFQEKNKTRFSTSLCSLLDRSGLFEDFNQYLSTENNLSPEAEDIPRIRRRQSIDVSKIESCLPVDYDQDQTDQTLLMPSIKITQHPSSPTRANTSSLTVNTLY